MAGQYAAWPSLGALRRLKWSSPVWSAPHQNFGGGVVQDQPRYALPEGAVWDAVEMLTDDAPKLRRRAGTTRVCSANSQNFPGELGFSYPNDDGQGATLYGLSANYGFHVGAEVQKWTSSTVVAGSAGFTGTPAAGGTLGKPFNYLGNLVAPYYTSGAILGLVSLGGVSTLINGGTMGGAFPTVTAGSARIPAVAAGDLALLEVGSYVRLASAANAYIGRVVLKGANFLIVSPTPTQTFVSTNGTAYGAFYLQGTLPIITGAKCGCAFQNRILAANVQYDIAGDFVTKAHRVVYSILPTETTTASGVLYDGLTQLTFATYPANNWFEVPSSEPIIGITPVGEGQVLILGATKSHRLTGQLTTQTATGGGITYDVHEIPESVGCIDQGSIQQTPRGVVFASHDGVYLYDGVRMQNLMLGRISTMWRAAVQVAGFTILGSAYMGRDHYIISTSSGGYICNLNGARWTRTALSVGASAADPSAPANVYAARWTDPSLGAAPTSTNNTLYRLDACFASSTATGKDHDSTDPQASVETVAYLEGDEAGVKRFRHQQVSCELTASNTNNNPVVTVTLEPGLAGDGTPVTLGTLAPDASGHCDQRFDGTTIDKAATLKFTCLQAAGSFELNEIRLAVNELRQGRTT